MLRLRYEREFMSKKLTVHHSGKMHKYGAKCKLCDKINCTHDVVQVIDGVKSCELCGEKISKPTKQGGKV